MEKARASEKRQNALQPVSKLSLEILQEIFLYFAHDMELLSGEVETRWDWLAVMWVCQYWREAAMEFPRLWTVINNFKHVDRIRFCLERSKNLELVVHLGAASSPYNHRVPDGSTKLLREHIHRVEDLALVVSSISPDDESYAPAWEDIKSYFTLASLPLLKRLRIEDCCFFRHSAIYTPDLFIPLVHLEALYLQRVAIPWKHVIVRGLSELTLINIPSHVRSSLSGLLDILDGCPDLRILKLIHSYPYDSDDPISDNEERIVKLDSLQYIEFRSVTSDECDTLFGSLRYPKSAVWNVTITDYPFLDVDDPYIPDFLREDRGHEHVTVTLKDDTSISFQSIGKEDSLPSNLTLSIEEDSEQLVDGDVFRCLYNLLETKNWLHAYALTLIVDINEDKIPLFDKEFFSEEVWDTFFAEIFRFEDLTLHFDSGVTLEDKCLHVFTELPGASRRPSIRCERLKALCIENANFDFEVDDEEDSFEKLIKNLEFRNENGKRLGRLSFVNCLGIYEEKLDRLRSLDVCDEIYCSCEES